MLFSLPPLIAAVSPLSPPRFRHFDFRRHERASSPVAQYPPPPPRFFDFFHAAATLPIRC